MCSIPLVGARRDVKTRPPPAVIRAAEWDVVVVVGFELWLYGGKSPSSFFFAAYQILRYSSIFFCWSKNSCDIFYWLRQNVERFFPELRCSLSKPLTISYFLLLVKKVYVIFLLVEKAHVRSRDLPKTRLRISPFSRELTILSFRIHLCGFYRESPLFHVDFFWNLSISNSLKSQLLGGIPQKFAGFWKIPSSNNNDDIPRSLLLQQPQNEPKNENNVHYIMVADFFLQRA